MDEKKEKLVAYLNKNLQIAEAAVSEFKSLEAEINELEATILKKKEDLAELGDLSLAIANVDEIRGFIEDLTKPEEIPENSVEEGSTPCEDCVIPTDGQFENTNPNGGVTF